MNYYVYPGLEKRHIHYDLINNLSKYVATSYGISIDKLRSKCRKRKPKEARQVCMYMLRTCTNLTLESIGEYYGKDHTTVIHAVKKVQDYIDADRDEVVKNYVIELRKEFKINEIIVK